MIRAFVLLFIVPAVLVAAVTLGGSVSPDDARVEVQCDLDLDQRIKNIGSKIDGAGMCVMSSIEMAARYQGLEQMRGLRDWCSQYPGGAYPSKVDKQLKEYCKAKGVAVPEYIQLEKTDWTSVKKVLSTGRIACVTYGGQDGVRYNGTIAHMVCSVHCDGVRVALMDNNGKPDEFLWMPSQDFDRRFKLNGGGWLFYWKAPPPPPIPHN